MRKNMSKTDSVRKNVFSGSRPDYCHQAELTASSLLAKTDVTTRIF